MVAIRRIRKVAQDILERWRKLPDLPVSVLATSSRQRCCLYTCRATTDVVQGRCISCREEKNCMVCTLSGGEHELDCPAGIKKMTARQWKTHKEMVSVCLYDGRKQLGDQRACLIEQTQGEYEERQRSKYDSSDW